MMLQMKASGTISNRDIGEILAKDERWLGTGARSDGLEESPDMEPHEPPRPFIPSAGSTTSEALYLPLSKDQFRLLEILPGTGDASIRCNLHVCALAENWGAYEALSYTWTLGFTDRFGSGTAKSMVPLIECNGTMLRIGINLYHALRQLRKEGSSRLLWADAVCINQEDIQERSEQVAAMGNIFRDAHSVLVWLGSDLPPLTSPGGEFVMKSRSSSKAFAGVCAVVSTWAAAREHAGLVRRPKYRNLRSGEVHSDSALMTTDSEAWSDVLDLYTCKWFSRLWVVQEIALARHATVIWGEFEISWQWIGLAAAIIRTNWNRILSTTSRHMGRVSLGVRQPPTARLVPSGVMNAYFMYRISHSQTYSSPLQFSFCELLTLTRQFECMDKHDKVFGLLGLPTTDGINSSIIPDYTESLSVLYHEIASAMLLSDKPLDFLSHVNHDNRWRSPEEPEIPSWVPRWDVIGPQTLTPLDHDNSGHVFTAGLEKAAEFWHRSIEDSLPPTRLVVRGVVLESVRGTTYMASLRWFTSDQSTAEEERQREIDLERYTKRDLEQLAMTLVAGKSWYGTPITDRTGNLADFADALVKNRLWDALKPSAFNLEGAYGPRWYDNSHFEEQYIEMRQYSTARGKGKTPARKLAGIETAKPLTEDGLIKAENLRSLSRGGNSNVFLDAVATACIGRSLFCTSSLKRGVGPESMKPGDQVCIIYGTRVPFIIRPCEEKEGYKFVGECYIDEYMNEEAIRDGGYEEIWIELV